MMKNKIFLIISREYSQRVKKKAFIIATILMPFVLLALMFGPVLLKDVGSDLPETIYVVDEDGSIGRNLSVYGSLPYTVVDEPIDVSKNNADYNFILFLPSGTLENPSEIKLIAHANSSLEMEMLIRDDLKQTIENLRLEQSGLGNVKQLMSSIEANVELSTVKIDASGAEEHSSALISFLIGLAMAFILYMFIIIYGQLVMMGIIEEKNSRVLELIVTSIKPSQLMLGKIIGIGLVAVTQVLIWGVIITVFIQAVLPAIAGPDLLEQVAAIRNGVPMEFTYDPQLLQTMVMLTGLGYIFSVFGYLILFLIGGFMLYSSLYAVIGSAVDNPQDGAQMQMFVIVPVIISLLFATNIGTNPDSQLAFWLSMIPFTSPMIMMARIPAGVEFWQIILSLSILYVSVAAIVWTAAKIYRVGIFMYGKKPTLKEIARWARYK